MSMSWPAVHSFCCVKNRSVVQTIITCLEGFPEHFTESLFCIWADSGQVLQLMLALKISIGQKGELCDFHPGIVENGEECRG